MQEMKNSMIKIHASKKVILNKEVENNKNKNKKNHK